MGSPFCPTCGTPRVGAFRFCRSCQFDFDAIDRVAGGGSAAQAPKSGTPATPLSYAEKYAGTQWAAPPATPSTSTAAGRWESPRGADYIVLGGLVLWVIAQALPAYTTPGFLEPTNTPSGLMNTLAAWSLAYVAWGFNIGGALAILIAWTANIWLVLAIVLWGLHRPGAALGFAILAVISAAVGMWFLLSGGLPDLDSSATVTEVGIGSWVWFASTLVVLAGSAPRPLPT